MLCTLCHNFSIIWGNQSPLYWLGDFDLLREGCTKLRPTFSVCSGEAGAGFWEILVPSECFRVSLSLENHFFTIIQVLYEVNLIFKLEQLCFLYDILIRICTHSTLLKVKYNPFLRLQDLRLLIDRMQLCITVTFHSSYIHYINTYWVPLVC